MSTIYSHACCGRAAHWAKILDATVVDVSAPAQDRVLAAVRTHVAKPSSSPGAAAWSLKLLLQRNTERGASSSPSSGHDHDDVPRLSLDSAAANTEPNPPYIRLVHRSSASSFVSVVLPKSRRKSYGDMSSPLPQRRIRSTEPHLVRLVLQHCRRGA
jgi:hypothetical protein